MAHGKAPHEAYWERGEPATALLVPPAFRPIIRTRRLVLRPPRPIDAPDVVLTIGDVGVARMLARVPHPYTRENAEAFIRFAARNAAARRSVISAITLNGRLIGVASIDAIPARCRLGYWLGRPYWGHGYATEALAALVAYAFDVLKVRQIRAGVYVDNDASRRVLAKLGFKSLGFKTGRSLAREGAIEHIPTVLTRARYLARR